MRRRCWFRGFVLLTLAGSSIPREVEAEQDPYASQPSAWAPKTAWPSTAWPAPAQPAPVAEPAPGRESDYILPAPPAELPYKAGDPIPPGYRVVSERCTEDAFKAYWALTFLYIPAFAVAAIAKFEGPAGYMAIPVVGPGLTIGFLDWSRENAQSYGEIATLLAMDSLGQLGAVIGILEGHLTKRTKLVRNDLTWLVSPQRMGSGYGVAAFGTF
jgi:hypothetical protein